MSILRRFTLVLATALLTAVLPFAANQAVAGPGGGTYYANSPAGNAFTPMSSTSGKALRKFVNDLPGIGSANQNNLGQYIPVATKLPDPTGGGADYYEIGIVEYSEKMHSDLRKPTKLRGYVDLGTGLPPAPHYLGPLIIATKGTPVRVKVTNQLATTASGGNLFIPVDTTLMGAGMGPDGINSYSQNRTAVHLHGGFTPWISDGTPHQWFTPAGETALPDYQKGASFHNVPDMADPGNGSQTLYYTNDQSSRLMFYHDHAYGITRLNVYAGMAAGYLLTDPVEEGLITGGFIPDLGGVYHNGIPLIIQDKTFVPSDVAVQDAKWDLTKWGQPGDLWFPHVYETNQNPASADGTNPFGRWDYGPWFWPIFPAPNPLPEVSCVPEGFMDTPVINGTAYPFLPVDRKAYRFRILNACNDRFLNLQLYYVDPADPNGTEVKMLPALPNPAFPATWPTDGRAGGVPDPALVGPDIIQIGNEGGLLPAPVVIPSQPVGYEYFRRSITVLNVQDHALFMGPAERADVIIDFSAVPAGSKLILYNDAPAPVPAFDTRNDYYTGNPDQSASGGAKTTIAGYGPNTRTIMQFRVSGTAGPGLNLANLQTALPTAYAAAQDPPVIPEPEYGPAFGTTFPPKYATIFDGSAAAPYFSFTDVNGVPQRVMFQNKTIQELFDNMYGRMNATLGIEVPFTNSLNQTTIPMLYVEPVTDVYNEGQPRLWKITHNGVDTHAIHFHLVDVQVINRVGWDGTVKPPDANELGWKETVRMNPLEDIVVAIRPAIPTGLPFTVPESVRLIDPTSPAGTPVASALIPAPPVVNALYNFGWEYVWHCHLLGHEENDMMRPVPFFKPTVVPADPTLLSATLAGSGINLAWTDNSVNTTGVTPVIGKASGFRIERSPTGSGTWTIVGTVNDDVTIFTDTNLAADMTYDYQVFAFNARGDSAAPTPLATVATALSSVVPAAASNLIAAVTGPTQVDLNWVDNSSNESGFRIERADVVGGVAGAFAPLTTVAANVTTYSDTTVAIGSSYNYQVFATNAAGDALTAATTATVTIPGLTPNAPSLLGATVISSSQVNLAWTDNSINETGFRIERNAGNGFTTVGSVLANVTAFNDTTALPSTTYGYQIIAVNGAIDSMPSNTAVATTPALGAPAMPTLLTATVVSPQQINLGWVDNATNETGFWIQRAVGAGAMTTIGFVIANTTTYSDLTALPSTTYNYQVVAFNASGNSPVSNIATATTPQVPIAPTVLGANIVAGPPLHVDLTWTVNSTNETGFRVERAAGLGAFATLVTGLPVATAAYSDTTAADGTVYNYRVFAYNAFGDSAPTNTATVTTPLAAPSALNANAVLPTQVNLTWTVNSVNQTGFRIMRADGSGAGVGVFAAIATVAANAVAYSDTTVLPNTTYSYDVIAYNPAIDSAPSNIAAVTTPIVPTAPTGLAAAQVLFQQVDLTWTVTSNNETGFRVERADGTGTFAALPAGLALPAATSAFSDTTAAAGTQYSYRVFAFNLYGDSLPTNTLTVTTPQRPPSVLTATAISSNQVNLGWTDNSSNETAFRIMRDTNTGTYTQIGLAAANAVTYIDTTVMPSTTYNYQVIASNAAIDSAASNTATVTTPILSPPVAPSGAGVVPSSLVAPATITMTWVDNSTNEAGFTIQRATNSTFTTGLTPFWVGPGVTTYADTTVLTNTRYYYRVLSFNAAGTSAYSAAVNTIVSPPVAPAGLTATPDGTASPVTVTLNWLDKSTTESGFNVQRADNATFTTNVVNTPVAANTTTYTDNTVVANTTYYYKVRASNLAGNSAYTTYVTTKVAPPVAPTLLRATLNVASVTLNWTFPYSTETGFTVQRADNATFTTNPVTFPVAANTLTYEDTTAALNTTYYYRVLAFNNAGNSPYTAYVSAKLVAPPAPTGLKVTLNSASVTLDWTYTSNMETGFTVQRADNATFTTNAVTFPVAANVLTYTDSTAALNTTYYYRVLAFNAVGNSPYTTYVTAKLVAPVAPTLLKATLNAASVTLSWTFPYNTETGFTVQRADNATFTTNAVTFPVAANVLTYTDSTAALNTTYYYRVLAFNAVGNSPYTTYVTAKLVAPVAPTGLVATLNPASVTLNWNFSLNTETGFTVQRADNATFTLNPVTFPVAADVLTYTDSTAALNTQYYYRVLAYNAVGNSPYTTYVAAKLAAPVAPTGLVAVASAPSTNPPTVTLTWTFNYSTETGFTVQRATNATFTANATTFDVPGTTKTYTDTSVAAATTYYYRVLAYNGIGNSPYSIYATVKSAGLLPAAPTGLQVISSSNSTVNISWTDNADNETGFYVERSAAGTGPWARIATVAANANAAPSTTGYTNTALTANTTYWYRVQAYNAAGVTAYSGPVSGTTQP